MPFLAAYASYFSSPGLNILFIKWGYVLVPFLFKNVLFGSMVPWKGESHGDGCWQGQSAHKGTRRVVGGRTKNGNVKGKLGVTKGKD